MTAPLDAIRTEIVQLLPRLRRFAVTLTGSVAEADDLVQDTVERALRNLHRWEPGTRLDNWMYRIAKNRFIDGRRSARRRGVVLTDAPEDAAQVGSDGQRAAEFRLAFGDVAQAFQRLPAEQREALGLVVIDGQSYRDAADLLGIPIGTLTSRIARAREALADLMPEG